MADAGSHPVDIEGVPLPGVHTVRRIDDATALTSAAGCSAGVWPSVWRVHGLHGASMQRANGGAGQNIMFRSRTCSRSRSESVHVGADLQGAG